MLKPVYTKRTSVCLTKEMFQELLERSDRNQTSLGEQIRTMIALGLKTLNTNSNLKEN